MEKISEENQQNLLRIILAENFLDNVGNPKDKELLKNFGERGQGKFVLEFQNGQMFEFSVKEISND